MKKLAIVVFVGIFLISFYACEKEAVIENQPIVDVRNSASDLDPGVDGKYFYREMCVYLIEFGRWEWNPFPGVLRCNKRRPGICGMEKICIQVPIIIEDPCWMIPCWPEIIDPWVIYPKVDPRITAVPFAMNEGTMGLQFYNENSLMSFEGNTGVFVLEKDRVFDAETSKEIGLRGNLVQAGKYPVLYNKENGTFNVILSVEKGFESNSYNH